MFHSSGLPSLGFQVIVLESPSDNNSDDDKESTRFEVVETEDSSSDDEDDDDATRSSTPLTKNAVAAPDCLGAQVVIDDRAAVVLSPTPPASSPTPPTSPPTPPTSTPSSPLSPSPSLKNVTDIVTDGVEPLTAVLKTMQEQLTPGRPSVAAGGAMASASKRTRRTRAAVKDKEQENNDVVIL
jgi:hypothetical protein